MASQFAPARLLRLQLLSALGGASMAATLALGASTLMGCGDSAEVDPSEPQLAAGAGGATVGGDSSTAGSGALATGGSGATTGAVGGTTPVGGSGGQGGGGSNGGGGVGGDSSGAPNIPNHFGKCSSPVELGGGWVQCAEGYEHRATVGECPNALDAKIPCGSTTCDGTKLEHCESVGPPSYADRCVKGCATDTDCSTGQICRCGEGVHTRGATGTCVQAACTSDAQCSGGALCESIRVSRPGNSCGEEYLAQCQRTDHECSDACAGNKYCTPKGLGGPLVCIEREPYTC